jgi:hypothetical protein
MRDAIKDEEGRNQEGRGTHSDAIRRAQIAIQSQSDRNQIAIKTSVALSTWVHVSQDEPVESLPPIFGRVDEIPSTGGLPSEGMCGEGAGGGGGAGEGGGRWRGGDQGGQGGRRGSGGVGEGGGGE